ncbi:hypothetical protein QJS10_CPB17g00478 [Acorus calamus]|uniref:Uncharacterized protein n=1 Tax=Acorus calamus TaxID=4465 RepID=A0AAV9CYH8_ACOCL|nr:hypothetical protein QJS10_CPB17g00478 [Acorus calamus]
MGTIKISSLLGHSFIFFFILSFEKLLVMEASQVSGVAECCSSGESGWTMYLQSPMHDDDYGDDSSDDDGDDDSMVSDASTGPSPQEKGHGMDHEEEEEEEEEEEDDNGDDDDVSDGDGDEELGELSCEELEKKRIQQKSKTG